MMNCIYTLETAAGCLIKFRVWFEVFEADPSVGFDGDCQIRDLEILSWNGLSANDMREYSCNVYDAEMWIEDYLEKPDNIDLFNEIAAVAAGNAAYDAEMAARPYGLPLLFVE